MCSKNIRLFFLVLLVLFLGAKTQFNCPHKPQIEDLQAGFATLNLQQANNNLSQIQYNKIKSQKIDYPLQTTMSKKPAVAISIEDININSIYLEQFHIEVFSSNTTRIVFQFFYKPLAWKIVKFNFWASSRSDIILRTHVQDLGSVLNQTRDIIIAFQTPIKNYQKMITRTFINGFSVNAPRTKSVNLALKAKQCEQNRQVLQVYTGQNFDLKIIWMSLLIFSPSEVPFASYGGGYQRQNWKGYSAESIHQFIPGSKYSIFGFIQLQLRTEGPLQLNLSIDPDLVFENQASRNVQRYAAHYILAGRTASNSCNKCNMLNYENQCVSKCAQTAYLFQYSNGGKACLQCSAKLNLRLNAQRSGCICAAGFAENSEGKCISQQNSDNNQSSSNNSTKNNQSFSKANNSQESLSINNSCTSSNTYWVGYKCICKPGFYLVQGNCIKYETTSSTQIYNVAFILYEKIQHQIYNNHQKPQEYQKIIYKSSNNQIINPIIRNVGPIIPNTLQYYYQQSQQPIIAIPSHKNYLQKSCGICHNAPMAPVQNPCLTNEYFNGKKCQCIDGFVRVNGLCEQNVKPPAKCLPNSYIDSNGYCQCLNGFQYDKNLNRCVKRCPINSYPSDTSEKCQCNIGFFFNSNTQDCQQIYCPPYSSFSYQEHKCICDDGRIQVGDSCLRCSNDLVWSQTYKSCVKGCVGNQVFDPDQQKCVCQSGFALYRDQCQRCPENHTIVNGYCEICPINSFLNKNTYKCECVQGYSKNGAGSCSKICKDTFWFNSKTGACQCPQYTYLIGGQCSKCPQGTQYNSQKRTCQVNNRCPVDQTQVNGQCVCNDGKGFVFQNEKYICFDCYQLQGGYLKDGHCFKCPGQTIFINGGCNCPNGLVKNSENRCSPKQPECGSNQLFNFQTYKCECLNGFFWINGQCSTCPSGRIYNPTTKICDSILPQCPNNLVENNGKCVCPPNLGFFTNINGSKQCINCFSLAGGYLENGICSKCPGQTVFTNGGCNCPNGLIKDQKNNCNFRQPECGAYQFFNQKTLQCECTDGYYWISNQCSKCSPGNIYNPNTKTCQIIPIICPNNQIQSNGKCVCPSGTGFNNQGNCINCTLRAGYLQNGFCKQCQGQTIRIGNSCQCPDGTILDQFKNCNKKIVCLHPQVFNPNKQICECPSNLVRIGGICSTCPFGTQYINSSQTCRLICSKNQIRDSYGNCKDCGHYEAAVNNICQCAEGYKRNISTGVCQISIDKNCQPGLYLIDGKCQTCKPNSYYDASLWKCICSPGFIEDLNQSCKQRPRTLTCPTGQHFFNESCVLCPRYSYYNPVQKSCTCIFGFSMDHYGYCVAAFGDSTINTGSASSSSVSTGSSFSSSSSGASSSSSGLITGLSSSASTSSSGSTANANAVSSASGKSSGSSSSAGSSLGSSSLTGSSASGFSQSSTNQSGSLTITSSSSSTGIGTASQSGSINNTQASSGFQSNFNGSSGNINQNQNNRNSYNLNQNKNFYQDSSSRNWQANNSYVASQIPICGVKTYLNTLIKKCQACPEGCVYCSSLTNCSLCDIGFMLVNQKCVPRCGDGITKHPQQCDDGNFFNGDGCSKQCSIQFGFDCSGTPSYCKTIFGNLNRGSSSSSTASAASSANGSSSSSATSTASSAIGNLGTASSASSSAAASGSVVGSASSSAAAATSSGSGLGSASSSSSAASSASSGRNNGSSSASSAGSSSSSSSQQSSSSSSASSASSSSGIVPTSLLKTNSPSLTLFKQPSSNTANVFVQLKTNPTFSFKSDIQMKTFIQYEFYDRNTIPQGGVYCTQLKQDASVFRCLLNYNSGVPTKMYSVKFFYDYNGNQASTNVQIDTLKKTMFSLRSLN